MGYHRHLHRARQLGVYKHSPANDDRYAAGWLKSTSSTSSYLIFPNRDVPNTQVTSRGIGWPSGVGDAWLLEYQVSLTSTSSQFQVVWVNDADTDVNPTDSVYCYLLLSAPAGTILGQPPGCIRLDGSARYRPRWRIPTRCHAEVVGFFRHSCVYRW